MKIGLLGGTFDPIHLGHLRAAESAREALSLERVLIVPARVPPHRPGPVSSPLDRFAMVALATAGHPALEVSDLELLRDGPSYTVETVAALRAARPADEVVLIVGSDTFPELSGWKDPARLLALCGIAVVARPREPGQASRPEPAVPPGVVVHVEGPGLPISASAVRRRVAEGRSVRYLVPTAVAEYISKRGLYR